MTTTIVFFGALAACGRSPLLNHKQEEVLKRVVDSSAETSEQPCAVRFSRTCVRLFWEQGPVEGENRLRLEFSEPFGDLSEFSFWATMPDMRNHGTAPVKLASPNHSTIVVSELWLVMSGRWLLHLKLKNELRTFEVSL
ncbi:MAG: hypothetical protein AB1540_03915 [Bdellovibrionota bacterium]